MGVINRSVVATATAEKAQDPDEDVCDVQEDPGSGIDRVDRVLRQVHGTIEVEHQQRREERDDQPAPNRKHRSDRHEQAEQLQADGATEDNHETDRQPTSPVTETLRNRNPDETRHERDQPGDRQCRENALAGVVRQARTKQQADGARHQAEANGRETRRVVARHQQDAGERNRQVADDEPDCHPTVAQIHTGGERRHQRRQDESREHVADHQAVVNPCTERVVTGTSVPDRARAEQIAAVLGSHDKNFPSSGVTIVTSFQNEQTRVLYHICQDIAIFTTILPLLARLHTEVCLSHGLHERHQCRRQFTTTLHLL